MLLTPRYKTLIRDFLPRLNGDERFGSLTPLVITHGCDAALEDVGVGYYY